MPQENAPRQQVRETKINQRQHARYIVLLRLVHLQQDAARQFDAHVSEISAYGCRIFTKAKLAVGDDIALCHLSVEMIDAKIIWREGNSAGCRFRLPIGMDIITQMAFDAS